MIWLMTLGAMWFIAIFWFFITKGSFIERVLTYPVFNGVVIGLTFAGIVQTLWK